jgi:hypothetical protein
MPWTPAQRRLFGAKYRRGELSKAQFDKMMREGVRRDVNKSGHAKKRKMKRSLKKTRRIGRKS